MTSLTHLSYFIPKEDYSNKKILKKKIKDKIINRIGIDRKFRTKNNEFASDLAINSIKKIFSKNNYKNKIDFFIM